MKQNNQDILSCGNQIIGLEGFGGCTLAEYQQYLLKILSEIDRICRKNDISYFLMYGTLIGAVRHHGFIPWDDDADVIMTRSEFNRFRECCKTELAEEFDLVTYDDDDNYNYTFPKLRLKNTTYIIRSEISRHGRSAGFFVDIILMDYVPQNKLKALIQRRAAMALHRLVSPGFFQSEIGLNPIEKCLVKISKSVLGKKKSIKIAERLITCKNSAQSDQLFAEIFLPKVNYFYYYDRHHFDKCYDLPFEGTLLKVPSNPISLLQKCYFRSNIENGLVIEHHYTDEIQAILENKIFYCSDIMFIPESRQRERHVEIIFDCKHDSAFYDNYYFARFDKRKNDRCAVRERRQREHIRHTIKTMEINEEIARQSCKNILMMEYVSQVMEKYPNPYDLSLKDVIDISENMLSLKAVFCKDLSIEKSMYILSVLIIAGNVFIAKRMAMILLKDNENLDLTSPNLIIENQMTAFCAIFEKDICAIDNYLANEYNDYFTCILRGIKLYFEGNYIDAENALLDSMALSNSSFWVYYYLGLIYLYHYKDLVKALKYLKESLNCTNYMPQLQLAIDLIEEINNG